MVSGDPKSSTGVELHTTTVPLRRDEVATRFGVEVTSPARTLIEAPKKAPEPPVKP